MSLLILLQTPTPSLPTAATVSQLASYFNTASLITGLLCLLLGLAIRYKRRAMQEKELPSLIQCLFTGYALPKGVFLGYCAFYPNLLTQMSDHAEYLLIAAFCTLYLAALSLRTLFFPQAERAAANGGQSADKTANPPSA